MGVSPCHNARWVSTFCPRADSFTLTSEAGVSPLSRSRRSSVRYWSRVVAACSAVVVLLSIAPGALFNAAAAAARSLF